MTGKAQAFNYWFKEYTMNAIIQPVHLILYTVFVSSAMSLARTNMLYALVAISFLLPAEKFIKKMFGLDRAESTGSLGSFAGGALTMQGMQKFFGGPPPRKLSNGNRSSSDTNSDNSKITFSKNPTQSANDVDVGVIQKLREKSKKSINGNVLQEQNGSVLGRVNNEMIEQRFNDRDGRTESGILGGVKPNNGTKTDQSKTVPPTLRRRSKLKTITGLARKEVGRLSGEKGQLMRKAAVAGIKMTGKAVGTVGGILMGVSSGAVTGETTDMFKYGVLGAMTGKTFGDKVAGLADNGIDKASNLINSGKNIVEQTKYDIDEQQNGYEVAEQNRANRTFEKEKKAFMRNADEQEKYKKMASDIGYKGDYKDTMQIAAEMKRENPNISDDMIKGMLKGEMASDDGEIGGDSHKAIKQATLYAAKNGLDQKDLSDETHVKGMNTRLESRFGKEAGAQLGTTIAGIMGQSSEYAQTTKNIKAQQKTKIGRKEKRKQKNK